MIVLAIDPGHHESAMITFEADSPLGPVRTYGMYDNPVLLSLLQDRSRDIEYLLAIERVQAMGMAVGEEVFETVRWEARFAMAWGDRPLLLVPRLRVKMHHCHSMQAKDANIRQAMLDRFGPGKEKAIGVKKAKGPLYGISGDCWSALAIATAVHDVATAHGWDLDRVRELWLKRPAA